MERWRDIPSLPGYQASDQGRVRSTERRITDSRGRSYVRPGVMRALSIAPNGYLRFNAKGGNRTVHRAVLEAFVGPCPEGYQGAHGDGNRANNALANLRWASKASNAADKREHGTAHRPSGEAHPMARLTEAQVLDVLRRCRGGEKQRHVAQDLGLDPRTVNSIVRGKSWRHLQSIRGKKMNSSSQGIGDVNSSSPSASDPHGFDPAYLRDLAEVLLFIASSEHIRHTTTAFRGEVRSWRRLVSIAAAILESIAGPDGSETTKTGDGDAPGMNPENKDGSPPQKDQTP